MVKKGFIKITQYLKYSTGDLMISISIGCDCSHAKLKTGEHFFHKYLRLIFDETVSAFFTETSASELPKYKYKNSSRSTNVCFKNINTYWSYLKKSIHQLNLLKFH